LLARHLRTRNDPNWIESKIKLGRIGELEGIMGAAVYLASDAAALVTGTSLRVDGGWAAIFHSLLHSLLPRFWIWCYLHEGKAFPN
jgi:NAD(P)-dependent dehydrogenase (short-subunit alcohol dehydrogenase family)